MPGRQLVFEWADSVISIKSYHSQILALSERVSRHATTTSIGWNERVMFRYQDEGKSMYFVRIGERTWMVRRMMIGYRPPSTRTRYCRLRLI